MNWILELKLELKRDIDIKALELELNYMLLTLYDAMTRDDMNEVSLTKKRLTEICRELNDLHYY